MTKVRVQGRKNRCVIIMRSVINRDFPSGQCTLKGGPGGYGVETGRKWGLHSRFICWAEGGLCLFDANILMCQIHCKKWWDDFWKRKHAKSREIKRWSFLWILGNRKGRARKHTEGVCLVKFVFGHTLLSFTAMSGKWMHLSSQYIWCYPGPVREPGAPLLWCICPWWHLFGEGSQICIFFFSVNFSARETM